MARTAAMRFAAVCFGIAVLAGCGSTSAKSGGAPSTTAPIGAAATSTTGAASTAAVDLTLTGAVKLHAVGSKIRSCDASAADQGVSGMIGVEIGDAQYPGIGKYMTIEGSLPSNGVAHLDIIKWVDAAGTASYSPTDNGATTTLTVSHTTPKRVTVRFAHAPYRNSSTQGVVTVNGTIVCDSQ
jgi:hypothetical protein